MRWVKSGNLSHLVNDEATGWTRTERYGALIFVCGRTDSEEEFNPTSDNGKHCRRCAEGKRAVTKEEARNALKSYLSEPNDEALIILQEYFELL